MNLSSLDLNLLKVLNALFVEGSTVRAAQRVGLSQPAVSAALSRLRGAFGDPLFVRRGQGLEPTDFARSISEPLRHTLDQLETVLGPPTFNPATSQQTFRISGLDIFSEILMPDLFAKLQATAPFVRLQHVDLVPDASVDMLDKHKIDLVLMPDFATPDWVEKQVLFSPRFTVATRSGNRRLKRAGIEPGETIPVDLFCDMPHILCSPDGNLSALGDEALAKIGRKRRVVMTSGHFGGVARMLADSDAIALLPEDFVAAVADRFGLVSYTPPMPVHVPDIMLFWHRRSGTNPGHVWLRGIIAGILQRDV